MKKLQTIRPWRLTVLAKWHINCLVAMLFSIALLPAGCRAYFGKDVVKAKVIFSDPNPTHRLTSVILTVGDDKSGTAFIIGGETETFTVLPGPGGEWHPILIYTLNGQRLYWDGPGMKAGQGYRIEITIDATGAVTHHRLCLLPCSLD